MMNKQHIKFGYLTVGDVIDIGQLQYNKKLYSDGVVAVFNIDGRFIEHGITMRVTRIFSVRKKAPIAYFDITSNWRDQPLLGIAVRAENFDDFAKQITSATLAIDDIKRLSNI